MSNRDKAILKARVYLAMQPLIHDDGVLDSCAGTSPPVQCRLNALHGNKLEIQRNSCFLTDHIIIGNMNNWTIV